MVLGRLTLNQLLHFRLKSSWLSNIRLCISCGTMTLALKSEQDKEVEEAAFANAIEVATNESLAVQAIVFYCFKC